MAAPDARLWVSRPARKDYEGAFRFLCLLVDPRHAKRLIARLREAAPAKHAAKDVLRASGLALLPRDESHVAIDLKRIKKGKRISPVLLLRGDIATGMPLIIADGYHRICAVYHYDEDSMVECRIVSAAARISSPSEREG